MFILILWDAVYFVLYFAQEVLSINALQNKWIQILCTNWDIATEKLDLKLNFYSPTFFLLFMNGVKTLSKTLERSGSLRFGYIFFTILMFMFTLKLLEMTEDTCIMVKPQTFVIHLNVTV